VFSICVPSGNSRLWIFDHCRREDYTGDSNLHSEKGDKIEAESGSCDIVSSKMYIVVCREMLKVH
jgi:hypothetical protein